ncbi:glycosyltransferase family 4 protein [Acinetobacter indicus]|uniref:glycosyltransferase family 4 protein n=1 Tax=Acinetobacter indicus TaxID=756892 RepID=UPI000FD7C75D|nr:glycosyltransferase family 4 protein [Acinetobacter indicus]RVT33618.1 glycosyltransferase [Acinetobacter indicus]
MKVFIWMNYPSHHQSFFFQTLVEKGVDLKIGYYEKITEERKKMGWNEFLFNDYEMQVDFHKLDDCLDSYKNYIHILPGYGSSFTRKLCIKLSHRKIKWAHWSEKSTPGLRWYRSYFVKKWYAYMVNNYALGALSQGKLAELDFIRWGVKKDIQHLSYSIKPLDNNFYNEKIISFKKNRKAFLYLGRLIHLKGVDLLLKAFSRIKNDDWCLIIIGDGSDKKKLVNLSIHLGLDKNILFHPSVSSNDVDEILSATDVFVLPSREDGWGVVLNEAASLGKPMIASDAVGAAWHLIEDGKNGYKFKSDNFKDLQSKMEIYTNEEASLLDHGAYSLKLFEKYNSDAMANNLINTLGRWISK